MSAAYTEPLFFTPLLVERVWGGNRLAGLLGKPIPAGKVIGESWELCDRKDAQTVVSRGRFAGRPLAEIIQTGGDAVLGRELYHAKLPHFPLLIKFIDAGAALSVQVHPDDAGAKARNDRGKSECWVVVHAEPNAQITRGLKPGTTRAQFEQALAQDKVEDVLHSFTPAVGDCIALPPGMVHAIGAGLTVAEIQQNSDITYRIYDYNRVGLDGKPRQLHVKDSLETIRFGEPGNEFEGDLRSDVMRPLQMDEVFGGFREVLLRSRYFDLQRTTVKPGATVQIPALPAAPRVLMCLSGHGEIGGQSLRTGDTALIPAAAPALSLKAIGEKRLVALFSAPTAAC